MAPEEWPISAPAEEPSAEPALAAGGSRLSIVMADFFLDPARRLTEQERALTGGLLDGLIGWLADQIRSALPHHATAANDSDGHALRLMLSRVGLLQRRDLMAILLRAADEERIASVARSRFPDAPSLLQHLISSSNADVSAAAMELILARGRRRDRFGQPRLDFDDLPPDLAGKLANAVAAACRGMVVALAGDEQVDGELGNAADALLQRRDEAKALHRLTMALAAALSDGALLDDAVLASALHEGDAGLLSDSLAVRAGIDSEAAWDLLLSGEMAMLLRMADVSRRFAAELIAALGDQLGADDAARRIEAFDAIEEADVEKARRWTRLGPEYRFAVERFGGHG